MSVLIVELFIYTEMVGAETGAARAVPDSNINSSTGRQINLMTFILSSPPSGISLIY
jgi:hypothetical protein